HGICPTCPFPLRRQLVPLLYPLLPILHFTVFHCLCPRAGTCFRHLSLFRLRKQPVFDPVQPGHQFPQGIVHMGPPPLRIIFQSLFRPPPYFHWSSPGIVISLMCTVLISPLSNNWIITLKRGPCPNTKHSCSCFLCR